MKVAPIQRVMNAHPDMHPLLVHTGQHYDANMSKVFFDELGLPEPDIYLGVGSGSHAVQTAAVMTAFEPVVLQEKPDLVLVVGDVNSTLACALVATKLHIPVAHVEAGLRSLDRRMPEEINRVLTDAISDLLFVSEPSGLENLKREGIADDKVHFVGNVMIDSLIQHLPKAQQTDALQRLGVKPGEYGLVTLHRPSNVDDPETLHEILRALETIGRELPLIIPLHPRTRQRIQALGLRLPESAPGKTQFVDPLGYLDFLHLMSKSRWVLTDSGGIQEETTYLGTPCLTLRENTERPITLTQGTNQLVASRFDAILNAATMALKTSGAEPRRPELWDGQTAQRIVSVLVGMASNRRIGA